MPRPPQKRAGWIGKFADAFRGLVIGMRGQSSFAVHLPAAAAVVAVAWWFRLSRAEWCLLLLCIAVVIGAELFNSALEKLARAITQEDHPQVRDALDIASGAVLVGAIGAAIVGLIIFASHALFP